jgi:transketolase
VHYGVREFGMAAIMNGLALYGGFIPFGGTFLVFSDYARNAIRLSALMRSKVIYVLTHDSIGLGEDGPTHQPIEHAASLRLIPGVQVWRPCDLLETAIAWQQALSYQGPSCLLLSRQNLPQQSHENTDSIHRGGYVLVSGGDAPEMIIMATGSEVQLAVEVAAVLKARGHAVQVASMPCLEVFEKQDKTYQDAVLPPRCEHRIAIEAGVKDSWYRWVGTKGKIWGLNHFGLSAPGDQLFQAFGFTAENIIQELIGEKYETEDRY